MSFFSPSAALDGESLTVDFPEHKSWKAAVSEMELAPSADSGKTDHYGHTIIMNGLIIAVLKPEFYLCC